MTWWENTVGAASSVESQLHPHCDEERAHLFRAFCGGSIEHESMDLLYSLVRLVKPESTIETGTQNGYSAVALGLAARHNGFGKVLSVEIDPECTRQARSLSLKLGLQDHVEFVVGDSIEVVESGALSGRRFDVAFFDSSTPSRPKEFWSLYNKGLLGNFIVFHDTSRLREQTLVVSGEPQGAYLQALDEIESEVGSGGLEFGLSRGMRVIQLKRARNPARAFEGEVC